MFIANQENLKLNGKDQLLVCADYIILLGKDISTYYKQKESTTFVSNKEDGIEAHTEDTKHIFVSREQHVGQHRNRQAAYKPFESMARFKYFGRRPTN